MKSEDKIKIYDRLLEIALDIPVGIIPDPAFINRKLGECHIYLGEVEKFFIKISREISVLQQALNNSQAKYVMEKEILLTTREDIMALPNIVEKTAKANSFLKESLKEIREYENELTDLNNLLKAINHKHRNLSRVNSDIKAMMKMVEAQIRIGGSPSDPVTTNFLEEMRKGLDGEDEFAEASSEIEETEVNDPTVPLNIGDLINENSQEPSENLIEAEASMENQPVVDLERALEPLIPPPQMAEPVSETISEPEGGKTAKNVEKPENMNTKNPDQQKIDGQVDLDELLKQYA